ncbi:MAG: cyclohydrolase [Bacteroidota bacterium]|nr:cyclohydrolase [Bacteroidota bacterium]
MDDRINKELKDIPQSLKALYDLSDEELEDAFQYEDLDSLPDKSALGYELFDANGNIPLADNERFEMIVELEKKFAEVLDILRISRKDPNSAHTPLRIARMFVNELMRGRFEHPPKPTVFPNRKKVDELIISKGIEVMSLCSHHWEPISGECAIGYIPGQYVVGLSKLTRVVDWFSRRGQIQEELGEQIADYLVKLLKPKALGVVIRSKHFCMIARGVKGSEDKSLMITSVMRGYLLDDFNLRNEFLKLIEGNH